jgi:2-polyprenyl-3-methyl-5-hydroxy-6-metoxy-1,4-benzoquinol methylase
MTNAHNAYQEKYFARPGDGNVRLEPTESPYVGRHLNRTLAALGAVPGERVLEVGAGLGRFTSLMLARGLDVVPSDLSRELLAQVALRHPGLTTIACDVATVAEHTELRFERAVGFFMLHHLADLDGVFAGLRQALKPGARVAFCEPNAYYLPYYLQIALSRHMTFQGDGGVVKMRPSVVLASMRRAGFVGTDVERYGFAPPVLYNRPSGRALDHALEALPLLEGIRAFQVFSASVP